MRKSSLKERKKGLDQQDDGDPNSPSKIIKRHLNKDASFESFVFSTTSEKEMIDEIKERANEENNVAFMTRALQEKVALNHGEKEFTGGERILKEKLEKLGLGTGM